MKTEFALSQKAAPERFLGTRVRAAELRDQLEAIMAEGAEVVIDFSGIEATQSFIDELLGVLVLERGPEVLERLVFRSCSENVQAVINFVLSDRVQQYESRRLPH